MSALTNEDRAALRGLGQGQVPAVVEQIVARHVAEARVAALSEAADAIDATFADPERVRPLGPDAECATDFANDPQWAAAIVRNLAAQPHP